VRFVLGQNNGPCKSTAQGGGSTWDAKGRDRLPGAPHTGAQCQRFDRSRTDVRPTRLPRRFSEIASEFPKHALKVISYQADDTLIPAGWDGQQVCWHLLAGRKDDAHMHDDVTSLGSLLRVAGRAGRDPGEWAVTRMMSNRLTGGSALRSACARARLSSSTCAPRAGRLSARPGPAQCRAARWHPADAPVPSFH